MKGRRDRGEDEKGEEMDAEIGEMMRRVSR